VGSNSLLIDETQYVKYLIEMGEWRSQDLNSRPLTLIPYISKTDGPNSHSKDDLGDEWCTWLINFITQGNPSNV
jgi:hypothetical protein